MAPRAYRFGEFTFDLERHRLSSREREIPLQPKAFETLRCLLERPDRLVSKRELHDRVWGDVAVSDGALGRCIVEVRKALGDSAAEPRYLQTVPRLGFRFIAAVQSVPAQESAQPPPDAAPALPRALVVLPFVNLSRDPDQGYFADGFTDLLIAELGRIAALRVISRTSAMCYREAAKPLPEIARELRIDAAVEGSILRDGKRVRITVQLIDAPIDSHLWADSYERDLHDLLRLQRDIARDVAVAIHVALTPDDPARIAAIDPAAHEAYLKGTYFWHKRTAEHIARSVEFFQRAIELDPGYAAPYAGLAQARGVAGFFGYVPASQAFPLMNALAAQALTLDPVLPDAHACLGAVQLFYEWDWPAAERRLQQALDHNPSHPVAREWYGWCQLALGRVDDAVAEVRRARDLDPLSPRAESSLAMALYFARDHARAIEHLHAARELDPNFADAYCGLGLNYQQLARWEQSFDAFHRALALSQRSAEDLASLGFAYGAAGRAADARAVLAELEALGTQRHVPAIYRAAVHAGLREVEHACEWLERAVAERSSWCVFLRADPWWDGLRADPRFERLQEQLPLSRPPLPEEIVD
jgi:TolB-like protein/Tfp pilus assembly protein PilF